MECDPYPILMFADLNIIFYPIAAGDIIGIIILLLLLIASALISGSEVAYFALSPSNIRTLEEKKSKTNKLVLKLLSCPERLLATILIANNFVNVGIVILSAFITNSMVDFSDSVVVGFVVQVIIITFILLLFGEIIPKVYASKFSLNFASFMSFPLFIMDKGFSPLSFLLIRSTSFVNKRFAHKRQNISIDDLSHALEITADNIAEDKDILEGIVKFVNIDVGEILKSRVDVVAVEISTPFKTLLEVIIESGYSRIPVYSESFDNIKGILYTKDLLPHFHKKTSFRWQSIIRPPYFVPETKKINDLLEEFQTKKIHMAVVVDEYGGTSGIVTLEDILEEIVGEIVDEYDEEEAVYEKIDENNYFFEGKTPLNDFYKITNSDINIFNDIKGDADTLAGLILEVKAEIPQKGEVVEIKNFDMRIEEVDKRRIKRIKLTIKP